MRKVFVFLFFTVLFAASCSTPEQRVMARAVPERADDFVFENNLIAGRFYGKALEGNPTSPGLDIWVKLPGPLVADTWYAEALKDPGYYHRDHGGKDCYKVGVSLGGGASVPYVDRKLCYPATNYRNCEVLELKPDKVVFALDYPAWEVAEGITAALRKEVSLRADSYFVDVQDRYTFTGADTLLVAAGFKLHGEQHTVVSTLFDVDRVAIWEHASDQGVEPEDGMIGVAITMKGAEDQVLTDDHALLVRALPSGGILRYRVGSCWSKGKITTAKEWFKLVRETEENGR